MNITSLFRFDKVLYNILLFPKVVLARIKGNNSVRAAKKNKKLLSIKRTNVLYICGNGPSLDLFDPSLIKDDYLVVNDFFRFQKKDAKHPPKYYMILDETYLDKNLKDRYKGVFNPGFETIYLVNGLMKHRIENDYPNKTVFYFCPWGFLFNHKKRFDFSRVHSRTWNVVSEAILLGIYLGYKEIKLVGCDYSVFASNKHFYSTEQSHANLRDMLYKYCFSTDVHYEIAKYAKSKKVIITNCTKDSLLDAYQFSE